MNSIAFALMTRGNVWRNQSFIVAFRAEPIE